MIAILLLACAPAWPTWSPGELLVEQIALDPFAIGESTLVVGPDGTAVLMDLGNDRHADEVREALRRHLGEERVDAVVLTHYHADHIGAFDDLFGPDGVELRGPVISRGRVDLVDGPTNASEYRELCETIQERALTWDELCEADEPAPCDLGQGPWPATRCEGLDDARIDLGEDAVLDIFAADGAILTEEGVVMGDLDHDGHDSENARSLAGAISWGDFRYVWGGDLIEGADEFIARQLAPGLVEGTDVVLLNHHGLEGSTGTAWLDLVLPGEDIDRHAIVGNTSASLVSPAAPVLDRLRPRLGDGGVWALARGASAPLERDLHVARGPVVVRVIEQGARYTIGDSLRHGIWVSH